MIKMGIRNWIVEQKEAHQRGRILAMRAEGSKLQMQSYELEQKRKAQEALYKEKLENETLKGKIEANAQSIKNVGGPSKLQNFGKGLAGVINKAKSGVQSHQAKAKARGGGLQFGAPMSSGSRGLEMSQRDVFGGSGRALDVGGRNPFGSDEKPKQERRPKVIIQL